MQASHRQSGRQVTQRVLSATAGWRHGRRKLHRGGRFAGVCYAPYFQSTTLQYTQTQMSWCVELYQGYRRRFAKHSSLGLSKVTVRIRGFARVQRITGPTLRSLSKAPVVAEPGRRHPSAAFSSAPIASPAMRRAGCVCGRIIYCISGDALETTDRLPNTCAQCAETACNAPLTPPRP